MKLVNVFLVAGLAGCSFALNINPPECAKRCFDTADSNRGCHVPVKYSCLCVSSPVSNDFYQCLDRRCSLADQEKSRKIVNHQCGRKPSLERRDEPESNEGTVSKSSKRQFNDQPAPWKAEAKATHPHAASEEPAIKHRANQQPQKDKVQRVFTYAVWAHFVTFSVVVAVMNAINRRRTAPPQPETVIPLQNEPNYVNTGASADEANIVIDRDSAGHVRVTHRGNHSHRSKQEGNTGGTGVSV